MITTTKLFSDIQSENPEEGFYAKIIEYFESKNLGDKYLIFSQITTQLMNEVKNFKKGSEEYNNQWDFAQNTIVVMLALLKDKFELTKHQNFEDLNTKQSLKVSSELKSLLN
ncbi:MAG: hypothetical protein ACTSVU_04080 [Promethearchaeota archaeon]